MERLGKKQFKKLDFTIILIIIIVLLFMQGVRLMLDMSIMRKNVYGQSMYPTLADGDEVLYINPAYKKIKRGSIVSLKITDSIHFVKRVVGLPNETVAIVDGVNIYINGQLLDDEYAYYGNKFQEIIDNGLLADKDGIWTLGNEEYFVIGDNRLNSFDSRDFGPVPREEIIQIAIKYNKSKP